MSFTGGFDDEEIRRNRYDFILYAYFDREPEKQFECRSNNMLVLRCAGDSASLCILNLLEAYEFGDGK